MRGKIIACDNCRSKKVKCDYNKPCEYCSDRDIQCAYTHVPKKVKPYVRKKKPNTAAVRIIAKKANLDERVSKLESMVEHLVDNLQVKTATPTTDEISYTNSLASSVTGSIPEGDFVSEDNYKSITSFQDKIMIHSLEKSTTSFTSIKGLVLVTGMVKDPNLVLLLNNLITTFIQIEQKLSSAWIDPNNTSRLNLLPPTNIIEILVDTYASNCVYDLVFIPEVKELVKLYCDCRDFMPSLPKFENSELLCINSILLMGCVAYYEKLKGGLISNVIISKKMVMDLEKTFLDNSLFYFHRVCLIGSGIDSIKGMAFLQMFAGFNSLTRPLSSLSQFSVRYALTLSLHKAEYYRGLNEKQKNIALEVWWFSYLFDKWASLRTGEPPIVNDLDVTAPPLPYADEYCFSNGLIEQQGFLKRDTLHAQIANHFEPILSQQNGPAKFFLVMCVDIGTIFAKVHRQLFAANNTPRHELLNRAISLLNDLENWKLCFPECVRPGGKLSRYSRLTDLTDYSVRRFIVLSDLNMLYYYFKLIITMFAVRQSTSQTKAKFTEAGLNVARSLLSFAIAMAKKSLPIAGFSLFYSFSAFLTISTYCIDDPTNMDVVDDITLLISACKDHLSCFTKMTHTPQRWITLGASCRCILIAAVNVVMKHNENIYFDISDLLEEVTEIKMKFNHNSKSNEFSESLNQVMARHNSIIDLFSNVPEPPKPNSTTTLACKGNWFDDPSIMKISNTPTPDPLIATTTHIGANSNENALTSSLLEPFLNEFENFPMNIDGLFSDTLLLPISTTNNSNGKSQNRSHQTGLDSSLNYNLDTETVFNSDDFT